jgi:hypothetical protein
VLARLSNEILRFGHTKATKTNKTKTHRDVSSATDGKVDPPRPRYASLAPAIVVFGCFGCLRAEGRVSALGHTRVFFKDMAWKVYQIAHWKAFVSRGGYFV